MNIIKSRILRAILALVLILSFSLIIPVPAMAAATVTPAAGGGAISADDTGGDWTTLGAITISEGGAGDIDDGVFVLTIPAGFEFNPASAPDVAVTGSTPELAANTPAVIDATTITVTVTANSSTEADNDMIIGAVNPIQVRPTAGTPLASGNIELSAGTIVGVTGADNFGTLTMVVGAVNTLTVEVQPSNSLVDQVIAPPIQVRATDQFTNNVPGQNIAVVLFAGTGTLSGTSPRVTNGSGIATFDDLKIDDVGPGKVLRFSFAAVTTDSNPFTISVAGITVNPTAGLVTSESGGADTFTIVLTSPPTNDVTIGLTSSDTSEGVVSVDNVTFTNGDWDTAQVITVTGVDDALTDGDMPYTIITAPATSADGNYNNMNASDVSVTNLNDEVIIVPVPEPPGNVTNISDVVTDEGMFTEQVTVSSTDNNVQLTIDQGTTGQTANGHPLSQLITLTMNFPPFPPENSSIIGLTYDFRPAGATFDQPVTITFTYNPDNIPPGVNEEDLSIAFYDYTSGEWITLQNITVDPLTHTITGQTNHFTPFTVLAFTEPANFAVSDFVFSPAEMYVGETSTVSVTVANTGDLSGTYSVVLKVDGVVLETEQVTLDGHDSRTVDFSVSPNTPGTFNIGVGSLSGILSVIELTPTPAPAQTQEPAPSPTQEITPSPTQTATPSPTTTPAQTGAPTPTSVATESGTNWGMIGGIIGGVIVLALVLGFWIVHRRD